MRHSRSISRPMKCWTWIAAGFATVISMTVAASAMAGEATSVNVQFCSTSNAAIPDNGSEPLIELIPDVAVGPIVDLNVRLNVAHENVGDLIISLTHIDTGTAVLLVDRPQRGALPGDCDSNNLAIVLDDEGAGGSVNSQCGADTNAAFPTSPPNFTPVQSLGAFDGENMSGQWLITVTDWRTGNAGILTSWCLEATLAPADLDFEVLAAVDPGANLCGGEDDLLIVAPGTPVRFCYRAMNTGDVTFRSRSVMSSLQGILLASNAFIHQPGETAFATAVSTISQDIVVTGTWTASVGGGSVVRMDSVTVRIDSDGDGVADVSDVCPGFDDSLDADGDATPDGCDGCPDDPNKIEPGVCGCGVPEGTCGNGNGNGNGNDNGNDNGNTNNNDNSNDNGNTNTNTNNNDNSNNNDNTNNNGNTNNNSNDNSGNPNQNNNNNNNGNTNTNTNTNTNSNTNTNGNNNSNGNNSPDAPSLNGCPNDIEIVALSTAGIFVPFDLPTATGLGVTITADPAPMSFLPVGDTVVTIEARNSTGVDMCQFTITVLPPGSPAPNECPLAALCGQGLCGLGGASVMPFCLLGLVIIRERRRRVRQSSRARN